MSISIRRLSAPDAPAYRRLRLEALRDFPESFGSDYDEQRALPNLPFEARLVEVDGPAFMLGAFDGAELVGICAFEAQSRVKNRHWGELHQVYVRPAYAGKSLGRRLVQATLEAAFKRPEIEQIQLGVIANNVAANRLYEKLGFREYGLLENYLRVNGCSLTQRFMVLTRPETSQSKL